MAIFVTRRQISAAKLRLALDEALGRRSAEWAVRVANAKPRSETQSTGHR